MAHSEITFIPAGDLLTSADLPTRPYEVAVEELLDWGDMLQPSALSTVPVALGELPDDAYPTELLLLKLTDLE